MATEATTGLIRKHDTKAPKSSIFQAAPVSVTLLGFVFLTFEVLKGIA